MLRCDRSLIVLSFATIEGMKGPEDPAMLTKEVHHHNAQQANGKDDGTHRCTHESSPPGPPRRTRLASHAAAVTATTNTAPVMGS